LIVYQVQAAGPPEIFKNGNKKPTAGQWGKSARKSNASEKSHSPLRSTADRHSGIVDKEVGILPNH
jgi:hypothetical protein